jgi:hypothetical protein
LFEYQSPTWCFILILKVRLGRRLGCIGLAVGMIIREVGQRPRSGVENAARMACRRNALPANMTDMYQKKQISEK